VEARNKPCISISTLKKCIENTPVLLYYCEGSLKPATAMHWCIGLVCIDKICKRISIINQNHSKVMAKDFQSSYYVALHSR